MKQSAAQLRDNEELTLSLLTLKNELVSKHNQSERELNEQAATLNSLKE